MLVLTRPDRERSDDLCREVFGWVFALLDHELHLDGDDAGEIAGECERIVKKKLVEFWGIDAPDFRG